MGLRVGLFGTGYWARQTHGAALAAHPDVDLVGVWGRDPDRATELADLWGAKPYAYVDALIAEVDAVAIAVPPDIQADLAARAAQAGRHLLLDKPIAFTTADADRIVRAVDAHRLASLVFFTARYSANVQQFLDESRDAGYLGARGTLFASIFREGNPYGASPWRRAWGGLWDVGPHALGAILPVLGPVERVAALPGPRSTTHVLLGHRDGATSTLSLTLDAPPAAALNDLSLFGERGFTPVPRGESSPPVAFGLMISELLRMLDTPDRRHPCDVRFGREVVAVLAAAQAATEQGRTVMI